MFISNSPNTIAIPEPWKSRHAKQFHYCVYREILVCVHKETSAKMFIKASFEIAKNGSTCLSAGRLKTCYICIMESYIAVKTHELELRALVYLRSESAIKQKYIKF